MLKIDHLSFRSRITN